MPIRKLPALLVNQIAAGEVIERPASVVKELVENSLDAGARRIDIAIEDGGRALVRISDDGCGIAPDELPLAVAPHATSKLQSAEQLAAIATLGFRGEALASIASVSRVRVTSRPTVDGATAEAAATIEAAGDQISDAKPAAGAAGTVIEVRDLFFNTPARRKFMRAAATEFGHIADAVQRTAMVHPDVAFSLAHNGRKTLELAAAIGPDARKRRCIDLIGREMADGLLEFEHVEPARDGETPTAVWGLAGLPTIARATTKFQYVCINGRPIRDRRLTHAVKEAYRGLIPPDRQPVVVVFIDMDHAAVDVNVHPTKAEVRFRDADRMHGLVLHALRQRLLAADLTPNLTLSAAPAMSTQRGFTFRDAPAGASDQPPAPGAQPLATSGDPSAAQDTRMTTQSFVDYFRSMDPHQKGFVYEQVRQAMAEGDTGHEDSPLVSRSADMKPIQILQVHKSYVVTQDEHGIVIVDQHALHERVMFEQLLDRVRRGRLESQRMLMPAVVNLTPRRMAIAEQLKPLLETIGIEVEPLGPTSLGVQSFASFLFDRKVEPEAFISELIDLAEEGELDASDADNREAALHEVLDMMACKAAVKAGDSMTHAELEALLARRDEIERSSNCPHGRPTTIRLTLKQLEKQFGRS